MKPKMNKRTIFLSIFISLLLVIGSNFNYTNAYDNPVVTIAEIQGDGFSTPYYGQYVETTGIVTADFQSESKRGFFIQDPIGDGNPSTSEGIFVYDRWDPVEVGDEVKLVGRVTEYYGFTEFNYVPSLEILSSGNPIPQSVDLNPPKDNSEANVYYESLESMMVSGSQLRVTSPTNRFGEWGAVKKNLAIHRVFEDDEGGTGEIILGDDAGGVLLNVKSGDEIQSIEGPLDYTFNAYKMLPSTVNPPILKIKTLSPSVAKENSDDDRITVASFNLFNLFDDIVDPGKLQTRSASSLWSAEEVTLKINKHAQAIHNNLGEPDIIAIQEVEKIELLERLAGTDPIETNYGSVLVDGPDIRGIDVGLMYNMDRVSILSAEAMQGCTTIDDGLGPGDDPNHSCPEGENPLFSRPPLKIHIEISDVGEEGTQEMWIIANHFKSKSQDSATNKVTLPRRVAQGVHVGNLVNSIQDEDPNAKVMVLGDLNDFEYSTPLEALEDAGLRNLTWDVKKKERYTFIFNGVSQVLDNILITSSLEFDVLKTEILHFNLDFPFLVYSGDPNTGVASTDHDVLMTVLNFHAW